MVDMPVIVRHQDRCRIPHARRRSSGCGEGGVGRRLCRGGEVGRIDNQVKISNLSGDLFRHDAPDNDSILTLTSISERYALLSAPSQRIPNLAEVERSPGTGTRSHAADRVRANGRPCRIGCSRSRLRVPEVTCPSSGALPRDPGDGCLDLRKPPTVETNQRIRFRE
jgi:hypothetical protein